MKGIGRKKLFAIIVLLSGLLSISFALGLGLVDVSKLPFVNTSSTAGGGPGPTVSMDPDKIIKDYLLDPGYQIGDKFTVDVNITDVTDLYTWQVNITWNTAILNFSRVKEYGPFLRATSSPNGTSGWIDRDPTNNVTIAPFNNTLGYAAIAESILGDYPGISGSGRLVTIEFEVVGYGCTNLTLSVNGSLPTTLLDSTGEAISLSKTDGYFRNTLQGDANGDEIVDVFDVLKVKHHRSGPPPGPGGYLREADINDDGTIDVFDILIVKGNLGREI